MNPTNSAGGSFAATIFKTMAEFDRAARIERAMKGRYAKARQGMAVTAPPGGYETVGHGQWIKDRDPQVQRAYESVFRMALAAMPVPEITLHIQQHPVDLPRRIAGILVPTKITRQRIYRLLRNPAYAGEYLFGGQPNGGYAGYPAWALPIRIPHHHPAYVTPQDFARIQALL